jgi:hypothetical protein
MMRGRGWVVVAVVVAACAHNVPQDLATSEDGRQNGAKPLVIEAGEAHDTGIVTYPGGDRVDWKVLELPANQRGTLEVTLRWTSPRPGLKLAFDVLDAWNKPVGGAAQRDRARKSRIATVADAKGKYFIRVYAVGRGDAGRYTLGVTFKPADTAGGIDWLKVQVADPPKLPDLPGVVIPCDEVQPDVANPECRKKCWPGAPPKWPGCTDKCNVDPPDAAIAACAKIMDCPRGGDIRVKKCRKEDFPPCADPRKPDHNNMNCWDIQIPPVVARILGMQIDGKQVVLLIGAGTRSGVGKDWGAEVLQGGTKTAQPAVLRAVSGGKLVVTGVDGDVTRARSTLTPDQLASNPWVRLVAPATPPTPRP